MNKLPARRIAWAATVAAILLAILPGARGGAHYDPSLAVLTATLIAVIWYTYYTHLSVTRLEPAWLKVRLEKHGFNLRPIFKNVTKTRVLTVRAEMRVWVCDREIDFDGFYRADPGEAVILGPDDEYGGNLDIGQHLPSKVSKYGIDYEQGIACITLRAFWTDDAGGTGSTPLRHYTFEHIGGDLVARLGATEIRRYFERLLPL